jgi:hypothetical protein
LVAPEQRQSLELSAQGGDPPSLDGALITHEQMLPLARRSFKQIVASGAVFLDEAFFDNRDIHEPSSFRDCVFMKRASFHGSRLHQGVSFHGAVFEASLEPARQCEAGAKANPVFAPPKRALQRLHQADAARRRARGEEPISLKGWEQDFDKARDAAAKKFCALPQKTADGETGPSKDRYFADLEDAFRTLKQAMEENRNRAEEGRFFKLEL